MGHVFPGIRPGNGQIEIFSRPQVRENSWKILCLSEQIFYTKQSLGAPDIVRLFTSPSLSNVRNVEGEHIFFAELLVFIGTATQFQKGKEKFGVVCLRTP